MASCTLNKSCKHTTGDYLEEEHTLKHWKNVCLRLQRKPQIKQFEGTTILSVPAKTKTNMTTMSAVINLIT
jgi:hypothetical protein